MTRLRHRVSVLAYLGGWRVVRWLPERFAYAAFALVGDLIWALHGKGVRQLEANLARVRPMASDGELRRLSRDGLRSYLRYWCDTFRLPTWSEDRILAGVRTTGDEYVRSLVADGRPVVMFLGHMGNWDHAGAWSTIELARVTTVAERLEPAEVSDAFLGFRRRLGMEILNLGDPGVFGTLARRLKKDGFVPLLADRDLTARGIEVEFFGETARMAGGPAMLAEITGAELIPVTIGYERLDRARARVARSGWGIVIEFGEPVKRPTCDDRGERVSQMLQSCADSLAAGIAKAPHDWHMLQKVFVADLDPARDARVRSEA